MGSVDIYPGPMGQTGTEAPSYLKLPDQERKFQQDEWQLSPVSVPRGKKGSEKEGLEMGRLGERLQKSRVSG